MTAREEIIAILESTDFGDGEQSELKRKIINGIQNVEISDTEIDISVTDSDKRDSDDTSEKSDEVVVENIYKSMKTTLPIICKKQNFNFATVF